MVSHRSETLRVQIPNLPSLLWIAYACLFLPSAAWRSRRVLRLLMADQSTESRWNSAKIWQRNLSQAAVLGLLSWMVGTTFGFSVRWPVKPWQEWLAAASLALLACLSLRAFLLRWIRSDPERLKLSRWMEPQDRGQRWLRRLAIVVASVSHELAYRGIGVAILSYSLGSMPLAILLCVLVYAALHAVQGWRSMIAVAAFAIVQHALVSYAGSLVPAILVHAIYNLLVVEFRSLHTN
ncbi:MAG: CPBP family intramembrane glutamic endopeptidase [Pirellulaceae bacterium]|jgi:membrane protease YdiL (CAAX protease family)